MSPAGPAPVVEVPGVWIIDSVGLVCTASGVDVTYTIAGSENVAAEGDFVDVQVRPSEGGNPVVSEFGAVAQGDPGPYTVSIESEAVVSGSYQTWVFRVGGGSESVKSNVVTCGQVPVDPGTGGEVPTDPNDGGTTDPGTDGAAGTGTGESIDSSDGSLSAGTGSNGTTTVTALPSTGSGSPTSHTQTLMLLGLLGLALAGSAFTTRRVR